MANARALAKRRRSIRNIRKITRTMELIATARFKKAMDRAAAATDYTKRITQIVRDLAAAGLDVQHPLLEERETSEKATLLALSSNRGFCGGFNGNVARATHQRLRTLREEIPEVTLEVSGKRGLAALRSRGVTADLTFTQFEDRPQFVEVEEIANRYLDAYVAGKLDRLDVVYTRFESAAKQVVTVETLLPLGAISAEGAVEEDSAAAMYEFLPSAESILEEIVPTSFKVRLFKCFLDTAVSDQIARMVAMKSATENADKLIKDLSMTYNRARQSQITGEIMEVIGGVEALSK